MFLGLHHLVNKKNAYLLIIPVIFYCIVYKYHLGNHDDDSPTMTNREKVLNYIIGLPGTLT
jgi:hypothetical protein